MSQADVNASKQPVNYQVLIPQEYYAGHQDDEISLIDLVLILWKKRFWIAGITGIVTVLSIVIAFTMKPVYETKAYLLPPQEKEVAILNLFVMGKDNKENKLIHTSESVYKRSIENLKSRQSQWLFFDKNDILKLYKKDSDTDIRPRDVFNRNFQPNLKIEDKKDVLSLSFKFNDKQAAVSVLNQYIAFINDETVKVLLGEVNGSIQFERRQIEQQIEQLRQAALLQRQDTIQQIKNQIGIAAKLNIHAGKSDGSAGFSRDGKELPPHYSEGTKALQIKLDALLGRKSDDAYIPDLRPLQARLAVLEKATVDASQVRAFDIDQEALEPKYPVKPKKRLIAILGMLLGLMLSVFGVFVWHYIEKYRQEHGL